MSDVIQSHKKTSSGRQGNDRSPCALAGADSQLSGAHLLKLVSVLVSEASASVLLRGCNNFCPPWGLNEMCLWMICHVPCN